MKNVFLKEQKGFTLVEVIISIAVLALICAIGLKLFSLSDEVTNKSKINDLAGIYGTNLLESCKLLDRPEDILGSDLLEYSELLSNSEDSIEVMIYFDEEMNLVPEPSADTFGEGYFGKLLIARDTELADTQKLSDGSMIHSALYHIQLIIEDLNDKEDSTPLVDFQTSHYFVFKE